MKIQGSVILNRNISVNTDTDFIATYKGHEIIISSNHGFKKPKYLTRFNIDVTNIKKGGVVVTTYDDFANIKEAIRYALKGACLLLPLNHIKM